MSIWTTKTDGVDSVAASHINLLQSEKMDRDGSIPATGLQMWAQGVDITDGGTLHIGSDGNYFNATGIDPITAIYKPAVGGTALVNGTVIRLHFTGVRTITNSAALALPEGIDIITYDGLELEFVAVTAGWRCLSVAASVGTWTPVPTSLTIVGTPTYEGKYVKIGRVVYCTLQVESTVTTAATAGSTTFAGLPFTPAYNSTCSAVNKISVASYGNGLVYTSGAVYVPTWPAVAWVTVSFFYFT